MIHACIGGSRLGWNAVSLIRQVIFPRNRIVRSSKMSILGEKESFGRCHVLSVKMSFLAAASIGAVMCEKDIDDPYENLPDHDEPTNCSICKTYRQGPCRPLWRKVEACTKDNDNTASGEVDQDDDEAEDGGRDSPCMKYILPWIECASGYKNLYTLIELDSNYTLGILDLEKEAQKKLCWASTSEPKIDWENWKSRTRDDKSRKEPARTPAEKQVYPLHDNRRQDSPPPPLWQEVEQTQDPELISITASIPVLEGSGSEDGLLECAYALDENFRVIGFCYGKQREHAAADSASLDEDSSVSLVIRILPGKTKAFTIRASYVHSTKEVASNRRGEADDDDSPTVRCHLYSSRLYNL